MSCTPPCRCISRHSPISEGMLFYVSNCIIQMQMSLEKSNGSAMHAEDSTT